MALRWGDLEARSSGGAGRASARLARDPDLFGRPLPRPLRRRDLVVAVLLGACGRVHLDQVLDVEAVRAQKPEPVAVRKVVLRPLLLGPPDAVHAELGPVQALL